MLKENELNKPDNTTSKPADAVADSELKERQKEEMLEDEALRFSQCCCENRPFSRD